MSFTRSYRGVLLTISCLVLPALTNAQEGLIEELVVTATKRAQTLQEIPVAVSVTTGETIEKAGIQDIGALQSLVPSLRVTQLQSSRNTSFAIRGFANGTNNVGLESSVGIFIDGVYRSRAGAAISDLPRLERVEVLSGPQSTLFGKNASAGVVSVITPKPSGDTSGYVSAGLSNFGGVNVKGLYESSLSDNLSFDISGSVNQRDGYFDNLFDGSEVNERDRWGVRGQLYWTPNDTTAIRIIADYDEIDEVCCGTDNIQSGPTGAVVAALGGQLVPNDSFSRAGYLDTEPFNKLENAGISGHIDIDYDNFTLTSITSFRSSDTTEDVDIDFTSLELTSSGFNEILIDTFTQELRLTSTGDGDVDWMIGGFYFDEGIDYQSEVIFGRDMRNYVDFLTAGALGLFEAGFGLPVGQVFFANGNGVIDTLTQDNEALSLFSTFDWHMSDRLVATVGLSYTKDEKEVTLRQQSMAPYSTLIPTSFLLSINPALAGLQTFRNPLDFPNAIEDGKSDDDDVTYTVRLAYDLTDSTNVYANVGTGFKASSWNLSRDSRPFPADMAAIAAAGLATGNLGSGTRFASPEEATVYELGLKTRFDRGSFNTAIFEQSIEGFQGAIFTGTGFVLSNAGEQTTKGIEFDLNYYPTDALKLTLAGTFLDPKYDSFVGATGPNGPIDLSGQSVAGVHEVSLSLSAAYNFQLGNNDAYVRGDFQYEDEVQVVENISADIASREVKLLNLAAGMSTENGLDYQIWMRNVTDEDYLLSAFPTTLQAGSFNGYPNEPRTYGVSIKKNF